MTGTAKALYKFFSSFSIPAYDEHAVPDDAEMPYITYTNVSPRWDEPMSVSATVWYKDTSNKAVFAKVDEISKAVGEETRVEVDEGNIWLYKDTSFAQEQDSGEDNVKAVYLQFGVHSFMKE